MRKSYLLLGLLSVTFAKQAAAAVVLTAASSANAAILAAKPGDEIIIIDGTYQDIQLAASVSGTASLPITIRAESALGVKFTGNGSRMTVRGSWLIIRGFRWFDIDSTDTIMNFRGATNCVFRDNELVNSGRVPEASSGVIRIREGSRGNIFERNRFQQLKSQGIQVWSWDGESTNTGNVFRFNHFVDNSGLEVLQLGQGVQSTSTNDAVQNSLIEHNLFEKIGSVSEMISSKTSGNRIRYNTFRNCADQVVLRGGTDSLVEGNYFFNSRGIRCHDRGHLIINNYLEGAFSSDDKAISLYAGNHERPDIVGGTHYPAHQVRVINNTIVNHGSEQLTIGMNYNYAGNGYTWNIAPSNVEISNNLIVNDHGTSIRHIAGTGTVWRTNFVSPSGSGQQGYSGSGVTVLNPLLLNDGSIWRLGPASTVLSKGTAVAGLEIDIEGQSRKLQPDVGCDEYAATAVSNHPLTPSEVGPGSGTTSSCKTGWLDCNSTESDGCEVDSTSSLQNCGSCAHGCQYAPHSTPSCSNSQCIITCQSGWVDTNSNIADGCESSVGLPDAALDVADKDSATTDSSLNDAPMHDSSSHDAVYPDTLPDDAFVQDSSTGDTWVQDSTVVDGSGKDSAPADAASEVSPNADARADATDARADATDARADTTFADPSTGSETAGEGGCGCHAGPKSSNRSWHWMILVGLCSGVARRLGRRRRL